MIFKDVVVGNTPRRTFHRGKIFVILKKGVGDLVRSAVTMLLIKSRVWRRRFGNNLPELVFWTPEFVEDSRFRPVVNAGPSYLSTRLILKVNTVPPSLSPYKYACVCFEGTRRQ